MSETHKTKKELIAEIRDLRSKIRKLENREETSLLLLQNPNSIIVKIDPVGTITFANDYAELFFGYTEEEFIGKNLLDTIMPENDTAHDDYIELLEDTLHNPDTYRTIEIESLTRSEASVWIEWTFKAMMDGEGNVVEIICVGNDVTRQKYIEDELQRAASTDLVTGLATRTGFLDHFNKEKYRFSRNGKVFSIIFGVVSNFHECIEMYGPDCGDTILKHTADIFRTSLRQSDIVGRWAGEELIIMLPETGLDGGVVAAEKILTASTTSPVHYKNREISFDLILCVDVYDREKDLDNIIAMAHEVLDNAEAAGETESRIATL